MDKSQLLRELDSIRHALERDVSDAVLNSVSLQIQQIEQVLAPRQPQRSIMELEGLGQDFWRSVDADGLIQEERNSWHS